MKKNLHPAIQALREILRHGTPTSKKDRIAQQIGPLANALSTLSLENAEHCRRLLEQHIARLQGGPKPPYRPEVDPEKKFRACQLHEQFKTTGLSSGDADKLVSLIENVSPRTVQRWRFDK
ncbi:MAG: hypothetical protein V3R26_00990 [Hyphomicrobium sp.]